MLRWTVDGGMIPYKPSLNQRADRDSEPPRLIILHSTGGAFAGAVSWLRQKISGVSAHFVVSRLGEIVQLVDTDRIAYHAGVSHWGARTSINSCGIGIEMEHLDGRQDWPMAQLDAVIKLVRLLRYHYGIAVDQVLGHNQIAPGRKVDPRDFPWTVLREAISHK
jgi:N-acetylmuramoyl-L-alanine amidase